MTARRPLPFPVPDPEAKPKPSLMYSLGSFFGHVIKGVRTDPAKVEVRREVEVETRETPAGPVVLRRTIVEEVQLPSANAPRTPRATE